MIGSAWQKELLATRREQRAMLKAGWEWVGEGGGKLWELERGPRMGHRIVAAQIGRNGRGVWVQVAEPPK